ncbi:MAG: YggT family protein [Eggerthellales bacterium]|nr:YggT family protein [Eggerthellales bacterium]
MMFLMALIVRLVDLYSLVICVYVLMSWLPTNAGVLAQIYDVLGRVCDPYLDLFKRLIPPIGGMIDITPIIALLVLQLAVRLLIGVVY